MKKGDKRTPEQIRVFKEKLRIAGIAKHGSEESWRAFQIEQLAKSRRNKGGQGGFKHLSIHDPKRLKALQRKGGLNKAGGSSAE